MTSSHIVPRNPPTELTPSELVPTFEVVRQEDARYVLVLDTSGSMDTSYTSAVRISRNRHLRTKLHINTVHFCSLFMLNGRPMFSVIFKSSAMSKDVCRSTHDLCLTRDLMGGPFGPPWWFFVNNSNSVGNSALKFSVPLRASILRIL